MGCTRVFGVPILLNYMFPNLYTKGILHKLADLTRALGKLGNTCR
ncbi:MAG: hypothetical protein GPOALKHO_001932 [Sodalis sp.]|nr:MAG: hypothetical protein GPOALKHO_001932 [Sodalis sp.]